MATIPLTNRIHTTTQHVPTNNLGSALANSDRASYSIQDLADTITLGAYLPLAGGSMAGNIVMGGNQIKFSDAGRLYMGDSNDLQIFYNGTNGRIDNTTGDLYIQNAADGKDIFFKCDDGAGGLATYFQLDGGQQKVIFTKDIEASDDVEITAGNSNDLSLYHNGINSYIYNYTGNFEIINHADGTDMYFKCDDGAGGITTYLSLDGGVTSLIAYKDLLMANDGAGGTIKLGAGQDLELYHDAVDSRIYNNTGDLVLRNNQNAGDIKFQSDDGTGGTSTYIQLDGGDVSVILATIKVMMPNLPTVDPGVAGQLWNDSGTLKIA
tara:strand:+ start:452 stop:1420 length:969 start_codon:yes stop_codon:yes gene_type:complete